MIAGLCLIEYFTFDKHLKQYFCDSKLLLVGCCSDTER